jgi:hypothetical protein
MFFMFICIQILMTSSIVIFSKKNPRLEYNEMKENDIGLTPDKLPIQFKLVCFPDKNGNLQSLSLKDYECTI